MYSFQGFHIKQNIKQKSKKTTKHSLTYGLLVGELKNKSNTIKLNKTKTQIKTKNVWPLQHFVN